MQSRFLECPAAVCGQMSAAGKGGDVEHIVGPYYSNLPGLPYGMSNIANVGNTGAYFPCCISCSRTYVYRILSAHFLEICMHISSIFPSHSCCICVSNIIILQLLPMTSRFCIDTYFSSFLYIYITDLCCYVHDMMRSGAASTE